METLQREACFVMVPPYTKKAEKGFAMDAGQQDKKQIERVVVFCGSKLGKNPLYAEHAERLGTLLGQNGFNLVYGGGTSGLMGLVSGAAQKSGSKVTGIITHAFKNSAAYQPPQGVDEMVVAMLHIRKAEMLAMADACIILPGGIGTQDEQWEAAALMDMQMAEGSDAFVKPVIVLNTNGIYTPLKQQMRLLIDEGFIHPGREKMIRSVDTPEEVIAKLQAWNKEGILRARDIPDHAAAKSGPGPSSSPAP